MSSDTDNKKSTPKDGDNEKAETLDKSTDSNSKDDVKNSIKEDEKEKAKISYAIVDESDPLKDELDGSKDDEKDPLSNTEDDNNEGSGEDPGSGDEKFDTSEEKNSVESDSNEADNSKSPKPGEGSGTPLSEISRIDASISRFKVDDLKVLYKILFNNVGKVTIIKRDIRKFCGFDFAKDSNEYKKKLSAIEKIEMKQLKTVCDILDLDKKGNKEEIASRICDFLVEPHDIEKPEKPDKPEKPNAASGTGRPRRSAAVKAKNRGYSSHEDYSEEETLTTSRRPQRARKGKRVNLKDESSSNESDDDKGSVYSANEDDESEEELPKPRGGRGSSGVASGRKAKSTPVKSRRAAPAKRNSDSDDDIDESEEEDEGDSDFSDEPKSKKARSNNKSPANNKSKATPKKPAPKPAAAAAKNSVKPTAKKPAPEPVNESTNARGGGRGRRAAATAAVAKVREASSDDENEKDKASSSEDEPLVKKSKLQPPTDDEIKLYVKEILDGANLEEITMKTVCKQVYAHYPDFDLAHKKDFIKTTVKSLIST